MANLLFYLSKKQMHLKERSELRAQEREISWSQYLREAIEEKLQRDADREAIVRALLPKEEEAPHE